MALELIVQVKSVYGVANVYPVCPTAQCFADIAGTKTLTAHTLMCAKRLGYNITVQQPDHSYIVNPKGV